MIKYYNSIFNFPLFFGNVQLKIELINTNITYSLLSCTKCMTLTPIK